MRISYLSKTRSLGPGKRFAIWMQGCAKRCKGCINPEGQDLQGGYETDVRKLTDKILENDDIAGITISGGELFLQYEELLYMIRKIKEMSNLDVMLFSGYELEELKRMYPDCMDLLKLVDIFVDGEYIEERNNNSIYRGSDNQHIYFFTNKYSSYSDEILKNKNREFSFDIKDDGEVFFIGIPPKEFYEKFLIKIGGIKNEWKEGIRS